MELSPFALRKVKKELFDLKKGDFFGHLAPVRGCYSRLRGYLFGPPHSPYEGGRFALRVTIPAGYPSKPPSVRFVTWVWHPNVHHRTGDVCVDFLSEKWDSRISLRTLLISLQSLLAVPNADDPLDLVAARQMKQDYIMFFRSARWWTARFAKGLTNTDPELEDKLKRMEELGFESNMAVVLLTKNNWEVPVIGPQSFVWLACNTCILSISFDHLYLCILAIGSSISQWLKLVTLYDIWSVSAGWPTTSLSC